MAWTEQQQTAIETRGTGLIVSAAAGSGKTSVLVERLTRIISDRENPVPVEKMIVVTFTVDAAAEIRHRLSLSLEKAIAEAPEDGWLRRQQMLLHSARISTINAFCFDLIREYMDGEDITSGFRVLDDSEQSVMLAKAADMVMSRWHSERTDDMAVLWNAFCHKSDAPLEAILLDLYRFFESIPFRDLWIKKTLAGYRVPMYENPYFKSLIKQYRHEIDIIYSLCDRALYLAADIYNENNNVLDWINADYDTAAMLRKNLYEEEPSPELLYKLAVNGLNIHTGNYPSMRKKQVVNEAHFNEVREIRAQYNENFKKLMENICRTLPYFESDMEEHLKILPLMFEMEAELEEVLWELKTEKNAISFADGETKALKLLAVVDEDGNVRPSAVAEEMSQYYSVLMIDEYQDSNNKQDYIFKLISHNGYDKKSGRLVYGDNVFLVGDVKQCIYRFRNANPTNFSSAVKDAEVLGESGTAPLRLIRLSKNFRSSRQVVSFVNFLFGSLMTDECGEIHYGEDEQLYTGAESYDTLSHHEQSVEVALIAENKEDADSCTSQAMYTAETIRRMLDEEFPVLQKDGSKRSCEPKDFCILIRNKTPSKTFVKELEHQGIPVKGIDEKGYLKSREISLLLSLLRVLDNPLLEVPLAAVMVSPMFSFTADDLAEIRLIDKSMSLYPAMCLMLEKELGTEPLRKKCRSLYDTVSQLRYDSALYPLEDLIRRIYDTTDFMSVMQLYKDGAKKRANLHLLMQYAKSYETNAADSSRGSVSGFLRYIDNMLEKNSDFVQAESADGSDNIVSIKTMHGSKGLEYPFVFVCMIETEFNMKDNSKKLYCTDTGQAGMRLQNPDTLEKYQSFPHAVIQNEKNNSLKSEELRLLYVSLTRAKQKLFIPLMNTESESKRLASLAGLVARTGEITPALALNVKSMSDWIWMCLFIRGDERFRDLVAESKHCNVQFSCSDICEIEYTSVYEYAGKLERKHTPMPSPSPEAVAEIKKMIAHEYDTSEREQVSLISVSAAAKSESSDTLTLKRPDFASRKGGRLTGAEHGTAVHAFFQYASFEKAAADPYRELQRLYEQGFITEEQMCTVKPEREVKPFFEHELYSRIRQSKVLLRERKFLVRISDLGLPEKGISEKYNELCAMRNSKSMMKGIIDLAFEEHDGYVLVDYKTDYAVNPHELKEKYELQLYIYSLALKNITGKPVKECIIYSTHLNEAVPVVYGKDN